MGGLKARPYGTTRAQPGQGAGREGAAAAPTVPLKPRETQTPLRKIQIEANGAVVGAHNIFIDTRVF